MILVLSSVTPSLFVFNQLDWIQNVQAQQQTTPGITGNTPGTVETATGNNNMTGAKFLFIQGAQSGSLSEINATTSTLELSDVSDKTILFSDRPDRIVSSVNTTDFVGNWSTGANSFAADPPNAVLVLDDEEERQELAVIELYNPEYDSEANTLKYDIVTENGTSIDLPSEFGQSTLVIDDDGVTPDDLRPFDSNNAGENLIDNPEDTDIEIINDLLVGTLEVENVGDSENDDDGSDLPTVQIPIAINLGDATAFNRPN